MHVFLISLLLLFFLDNAFAVQLYVDDEVDLSVYRREVPPSNIGNNTNFILIRELKHGLLALLPASYKRSLKAMRESNDVVCVANRIKTPERMQEFLFSLPVNIYLSRRLYQHASDEPLDKRVLNEQGEIKSLPHLFSHYRQSLLVVAPTVSYGPFLDRQLEKVSNENKLFRDGSNYYDTMYHMFRKKRADFLLGFPAEIYRHQQQLPTQYREYDIADAPKYVVGHWMCNNNPKSRKFLQLFDGYIRQIYQKRDFYDAHLKWLPETAQQKTKIYLDEVLGQLMSQTP
ncbi:hypothetical protein [Pseudoalteromonas byunsanensis]|uniref:Solute-binding protein family 3/N-terminal domain-containing protein n=1 Tax=Pseudoalteromonas byunsanensis TaxID=327939 RepID=A0A1S1MXP5_9GAMM|nr:hypothetical protein [Pseudoalteromonas byunsanensis]OHU93682.1 hypothetical protein BIW53_20315 [Pseudoalteromonas byunsanensis]